MKTLKKFPLLLLAIVALWSCESDDDNTTPVNQSGNSSINVVATARAADNLSILVGALTKVELTETLSGEGPFTVLAPTNEAFTEFLTANNWTSLTDIPDAALKQVLLNHVISGSVASTALTSMGAGYTNSLATGAGENPMSLYFNTDAGVTFNGMSSVTTADVAASNGIVHIVDKVIGLPSLLTFATADPNFSVLEAAVTNENQGAVAGALAGASADSALTVFAPVDAAFVALLESNDAWNGLEDIPSSVLTSVLLHHVVAGNVASSDLNAEGDTVPATVLGQNITITLPGTAPNIADITDGAGNMDIGVIAVDVQASNGVIHAVNKVLLPMM